MKNKKLVMGIGIVVLLIVSGIIYFIINKQEVETEEEPGVVTVSESKIFDDTDDVLQRVFIRMLAYTDATESGDNVVVHKDNPGFKFECHGLDTSKKLYVFIDGDIDDVAAEYDKVTESFSGKIMLKSKDLGSDEHIVQFVQFDGWTPTFCKTRHYTVED